MKRLVMIPAVVAAFMFFLIGSTVTAQDFCKGNFDYDKDVDGSDAFVFKEHFGRSMFDNPCPPDGPAPVEKSWQSPSYEGYDDGYYHMGVSWSLYYRFTDNGNGTVTDTLTGLIWLKEANCWGQLQWSQALIYAHGLVNGQCGLTDGSIVGDWRLPNVKEMTSLIDYDFYNPAMHQSSSFNNVQSSFYWSSTTNPGYFSPTYAWAVDLEYGGASYGHKGNYQFVWPVRGGHPY